MESKLKAVRRAHKGVVTKLLRKYEDISQNPNVVPEEVSTLIETLSEKRTILVQMNSQILDLTSEEDVEEELDETDEYMFTLDTKLKQIKNFMSSLQSKTPSVISHQSHTDSLNPTANSFIPSMSNVQNQSAHETNNIDSQHATNASTSAYVSQNTQPMYGPAPQRDDSHIAYPQISSVSHTSSQNHRLPKLDLPHFDGDILQWQTFWDSFESAIHVNPSLTDIQKFSYLKAQLRNAAAQSIEGFPLTNANYATAVGLLRDRFGQTKQIIRAYMKSLMELPTPGNDLYSLRNYSDKLEAYVRGLESLGQTQEMYGTLLVPVVIEKLPFEIQKTIARDNANGPNDVTLEDLRKAILKEIKILETVQPTLDRRETNPTVTFFTGAKQKPKFQSSVQRDTKVPTCVFCGERGHKSPDCNKVNSYDDRIDVVKRKKLCFNCLGHHTAKECKSSSKCRKCNRRHHTSLCNPSKTNEKKESVNLVTSSQEENVSNPTVLHSTSDQGKTDVMLKTAIATAKFRDQRTDAHILFDEGAQRSFITQKLAKELGVTGTTKETIHLSAFGDTGKNVRHLESGTISLQMDNGELIPINVLIVPDIAVPIQNLMTKKVTRLPHLKGLKFAHPITTDGKFEISLLIGADSYWKIVGEEVIKGDGPTAVSSKLGYLLSGPTKTAKTQNTSVYLNIIAPRRIDDDEIANFWKLESIGIKSDETDHDVDYFKNYQENSIRIEDDHYVAKLPWKQDHESLPSNYAIVKARTENTIRKLSNEPDLLHTYDGIIKVQEKRGFIEKVPEDEETRNAHYIPHHAVKKDSITTPIRIVYDCSCRQSREHASLNDCLMSTPPITNDLTKILMRFRMYKYGVSTDIEKAFLQIQLDTQDRDYTRFLWLSDPENPSSPLITYRFRSVLFGATCSPFILNATLIKHLEACNTKSALAIKDELYVDNILSSRRTEDELVSFYKEARSLMSQANFNLRSWTSNSPKLKDLALDENVLDKDLKTKILGLHWSTESDKIQYAEVHIQTDTNEITKRDVLSQSSKIYDPMGILGPVTVRAKILLQEMWKLKLDWDEPLKGETLSTWTELAKDLQTASSLEIDRHYFSNSLTDNHDASQYQLHVFVDSSTTAYGAVAYICSNDTSTIVIAKNRVTPLKKLTLPQLELMAALIGARLGKHLMDTLPIRNVVFWSDSQIVLHWLNTDKTLKRFVRNRVDEIKGLTRPYAWRYCPTHDNPADLQTRGIPATQLLTNKLWFNGPQWILEEHKWPTWNCTTELTALLNINTDEISENDTVLPNRRIDGVVNIMDITRYSTYKKLLRVTAYLNRFIYNCRYPGERKSEELTATEMQCAAELWVKDVQRTAYFEELESLKSNRDKKPNIVKQLRLFIDAKGILRCGGRIHNAPLPDSARFPYLLPKTHHLTKLIVMNTHLQLKHSGVLSTVTQIRQTFWIPCIRQCVRNILSKCLVCKKYDGQSFKSPDPPPLQKVRLTEAPPFTVTGVDFTGPLYVRDTKSVDTKAYICLFTCANTRAIHLEIVTDLTEDSFLLAFRRFASRKSMPKIMISDNGSTFLAASGTIEKLTNSPKVTSELATKGTTWQFIPKRAPWYGGFWERLIGVTKKCLRKTLEKSLLTLEMLQTTVTELETVLNDRPLTYNSASFDDEGPLTPSHLLYGRRISTMPYPSTEVDFSDRSDKTNICKRFERQRNIIDHFWNRWRQDYLTSLREFHKVTGDNKRTIRVGDVVHIHDEKPRNSWKIAIVEELIEGHNGHVRAAIVRTSSGRTSRPIVKLYPMEVNSRIDDESTISDDDDEDRSTEDSTRRPQREASIRARQKIQKLIHGL